MKSYISQEDSVYFPYEGGGEFILERFSLERMADGLSYEEASYLKIVKDTSLRTN